jgi:hypothetical protein
MRDWPASRAGAAATIAAALAVVTGLVMLGTPSRARERRMDELRTSDLAQLSTAIDEYWNKHSALPAVLDSLVSGHQLDRLPADPESNSSYKYVVSGEHAYRLCATFAQPTDTMAPPRSYDYLGRSTHRSWRHGKGESCFDLTARWKTTS